MVSESVQTNGISSPNPNYPNRYPTGRSQPFIVHTLPRGTPPGQYQVQVNVLQLVEVQFYVEEAGY